MENIMFKTTTFLALALGFAATPALANQTRETVACEEVEAILANPPASFVKGPCSASRPARCLFQVEVEGVKYSYSFTNYYGRELSSCSRTKLSAE